MAIEFQTQDLLIPNNQINFYLKPLETTTKKHLIIYLTEAPLKYDRYNELVENERIKLYEGSADEYLTLNFNVAGLYKLFVQEYTRNIDNEESGYENQLEPDENLTYQANYNIYIAYKMSLPINLNRQSFSLEFWLLNDKVYSPAYNNKDPKLASRRIATAPKFILPNNSPLWLYDLVKKNTVRAALKNLIGSDLEEELLNMPTTLQRLITNYNAHIISDHIHYKADTSNSFTPVGGITSVNMNSLMNGFMTSFNAHLTNMPIDFSSGDFYHEDSSVGKSDLENLLNNVSSFDTLMVLGELIEAFYNHCTFDGHKNIVVPSPISTVGKMTELLSVLNEEYKSYNFSPGGYASFWGVKEA